MDAEQAFEAKAEQLLREAIGHDDFDLEYELPEEQTGRRYDRLIREKRGLRQLEVDVWPEMGTNSMEPPGG